MRARHLLVLVAVAAACDGNAPDATVKLDGAAGAAGSGGASATGGASPTGGVAGTGGASATGGVSATGGSQGAGGASARGGATASGGTSGMGGVTGTGGGTGAGGEIGRRRDAGADARLDTVTGTGGSGAGTGGSGGTQSDAGPEARSDLPGDIARDAGADTGFFKPVPVPDGGTCPFKGNVTYTLRPSSDSTADQQIKAAMDQALFYYNCYTNLTKALNVSYDPSVQTADGNSNGTIHFGPAEYRILRVAMHETGHAFGIGTASNWNSFIAKTSSGSGPWTGANGIAQREALLPDHWEDTQRVLTADGHCFWPYGLSQPWDYETEDDLIGHCMMVMAIRMDLGLK